MGRPAAAGVSAAAGAGSRRGAADRGMVTAELAAAVPALLVVLAMGVAGVRLGIDEVRCVDAARSAARALARGDTEAAARGLALRAAPPGAVVSVVSGVLIGGAGAEVQVDVSAQRDVLVLTPVTVRGSATAVLEDAAVGGVGG